MGNLVWKDLARLVSMAAGLYQLWGAIWGIFFRKFFWDIIGGTLGPTGIIPPPSAKLFIQIIVDMPILQIVCIVNGVITLASEWPLGFLKATPLHRSLVVKCLWQLYVGLIAALIYQTVDSAVYSFIAFLFYAKGCSNGETMEEKKPAGRGEV